MDNKLEVSVILPVYNAERTIRKTILSVLEQKDVLLELVVINDGSIDGTCNVLNEFKNKENIKIFTQENKGVSYARNEGIRNARGEYCFFIDSDDYLEKSTLAKMISLAKAESLELVSCSHREINSTMNLAYNNPNKSLVVASSDEISKNYDLFYFQSAYAKLFNTNIIKKNSLYFNTSMDLGEDLNFSLNYLLYVSRIGYINSANYIINNVNPYSLSKRYSFNMENDIEIQIASWRKLASLYPTLNIEYQKKHMNFELYLLKVYFGNLFRFDSPLSIKVKVKKIGTILKKYNNWTEKSSSKGNPQNFIDKISSNVICTNNVLLIYIFFYVKEKIRRIKFFVGRKKNA